eukprot:gene13895-4844_t
MASETVISNNWLRTWFWNMICKVLLESDETSLSDHKRQNVKAQLRKLEEKTKYIAGNGRENSTEAAKGAPCNGAIFGCEQCKAVQSSAKQCKAVQSSAKQCKAVQSSAKQCKAVQSSAKQCKAVQSSAKQCKAVQSSAKQCKAVQSSAKQCKAVQSSADTLIFLILLAVNVMKSKLKQKVTGMGLQDLFRRSYQSFSFSLPFGKDGQKY